MSMQFKQQMPPGGILGATSKPVTWYVLSQTEVVQPTTQGRLMSGVKVTFQLSTGETGSVFVPDSDYTLDNVQAAIQARVALLAGVGGLSGSHSPV